MHGGDIYTFQRETGIEALDFSENTNPYGLPKGVQKAIIEQVESFHVYPDPNCRELAEAVSKYYRVAENHLLFGNGAADIIFKLAYALRPKKALILAPTFSEYESALQKVGTEIQYFYLDGAKNFAITEGILEQISGNNIVYICNPNNPTGKVCNKEIMIKIAEKCREVGAYLVVDECFMDFVAEPSSYSLVEKVGEYKNLVILKAFTKIFAMAGVRLGFCISSDWELLEKIGGAGQPWSVSTVAQVAGIACCKEEIYVRESLIEIQESRKFLIDALTTLGWKVYDSDANYILFQSEEPLIELLKEQGIMIRSCSDYRGLDDTYYRIGVKSSSDNQRLVKILTRIKMGGDFWTRQK